MEKSKQKHFDRVFHDKDGRLSLFQKPNPPLIGWVLFLVASKLTSGTPEAAFSILSFGALFTWAWLELFQGSCYMRRALGLLILIAITTSRI